VRRQPYSLVLSAGHKRPQHFDVPAYPSNQIRQITKNGGLLATRMAGNDTIIKGLANCLFFSPLGVAAMLMAASHYW